MTNLHTHSGDTFDQLTRLVDDVLTDRDQGDENDTTLPDERASGEARATQGPESQLVHADDSKGSNGLPERLCIRCATRPQSDKSPVIGCCEVCSPGLGICPGREMLEMEDGAR